MGRLFVLCWLLLGGVAQASVRVWIDADPAIGAPWREVDDAFALVLAFHSPEIEIAGLSSTYGNAGLLRTTTVARQLAQRFGSAAAVTEQNVHAGARSPRDGAKGTAATEALARALHEKRLTYIALGPLTNLAASLRLQPELSHRIERVIIVGGQSTPGRNAFGRGGFLSVHDANVFKDPAAVAVVLHSSIPIVLAPVELAPQLALTRAEMRTLRGSGAAGDYLYRETRVWLWFWTKFAGEKGGLAFDLLALLPALRNDLIVTEPRFAALNDDGELIVHPKPARGRARVNFATELRAKAKLFVLERLRRRPN